VDIASLEVGDPIVDVDADDRRSSTEPLAHQIERTAV
jgi:hypothetical protein